MRLKYYLIEEWSAAGARMKMTVLYGGAGVTGLQHTGSPLIVVADGATVLIFSLKGKFPAN
jgi:hypothetical protein